MCRRDPLFPIYLCHRCLCMFGSNRSVVFLLATMQICPFAYKDTVRLAVDCHGPACAESIGAPASKILSSLSLSRCSPLTTFGNCPAPRCTSMSDHVQHLVHDTPELDCLDWSGQTVYQDFRDGVLESTGVFVQLLKCCLRPRSRWILRSAGNQSREGCRLCRRHSRMAGVLWPRLQKG